MVIDALVVGSGAAVDGTSPRQPASATSATHATSSQRRDKPGYTFRSAPEAEMRLSAGLRPSIVALMVPAIIGCR